MFQYNITKLYLYTMPLKIRQRPKGALKFGGPSWKAQKTVFWNSES